MLTTDRLLRIVIELMFVLLGVLVVWLGVTGRIYVDRGTAPWMILSVALILWGLYAFYRPGRAWLRGERWTRGLSLILLGVVMLAIARAPFLWVGKLFALAGLVLVLRGLVGSVLVLRPR
jgi:hypothetical protein